MTTLIKYDRKRVPGEIEARSKGENFKYPLF